MSELISREEAISEYRERMIQAFHNADCDSLIAVVVLPTEKEFQHLEWLLKKEYVPFLEKAKRHGKWKQVAVMQECFDIAGIKTWGIKYMCESCGFQTFAIEGHFAQYNYCPQCGARMDEDTAEPEVKNDQKTVTAKVVTNGNCCICGKPLVSGLFLCEKCAAHTEADHE